MKRCKLDKIASVTQRLELDRSAVLTEEIPAEEGTVIAARVLNAKTRYNTLEDVHGRMVTLHPGDLIAGALGHRDALYGYSGHVPEQVAPGDTLQLLNIGGVIGTGAVSSPEVGEPFALEVLGCVLEFPYVGTRVGVPAQIARGSLPRESLPPELPPVVCLLGTCMDAGKTTAAAAIIGEFVRGGLRVAAGKLTGVSLRRDVLHMADCGAVATAVFTDFGVVTTSEDNALPAAHALVAHLADSDPDVIVLEMGDGLLGTYGVHALLSDEELRDKLTATVLCAQDPVGAWGAQELLRSRYGLEVDAVCGRVTDTPVGVRFCREKLEVEGWNALGQGHHLAECLKRRMTQVGVPS